MSVDVAHDGKSLSSALRRFFRSDSISEEGLRQIFERYGLTSVIDNRDISDYRFFFRACRNGYVNEGVIRCLIEFFPDAPSAINEWGETPLHRACCNRYVTPSIIRLLIDSNPSACQHADNDGYMPLHELCWKWDNCSIAQQQVAIEIVKIFLKECPSSTRHANNEGKLPIHYASSTDNAEMCSMLIDAFPGSERIRDGDGYLPFHHAVVESDSIATVKYLFKLYPDAINCTLSINDDGPQTSYPIHKAILNSIVSSKDSNRILRFLLDCDPDVKLQKCGPYNLLEYACVFCGRDGLNIDEVIQTINIIYDAHPELIDDEEFGYAGRLLPHTETFLDDELLYTYHAENHELMTTPDEKGQLRLHHALQGNVRLGSIKLLVAGNPSAIRSVDMEYALPFQLACEHHHSPEVIQYLLGLDQSFLRYEDSCGNTALHYACRGANFKAIALLLDKHGAVSVSKRNIHSKLPIDLLFESNAVEDREGSEYIDSMFRLLRAYPGTLLDKAKQMRRTVSGTLPRTSLVGKKRKADHLNE